MAATRSVRNLLLAFLLLGFLGQPTSLRADPPTPPEETATPDNPGGDAPRQPGRDAHLDALGVRAWHQVGRLGKGVKVAILDSGFHGWRDHLGKALPKTVTVQSFRKDGRLDSSNSQHGILCAEVVHSLAPEAELLFANWEPDHPESFLDAVKWARSQGAKVISCSVIMPGWSDGHGGGPIHAQLATVVGDGSQTGDVLTTVSAGNIAQRHWSGPFRADDDGLHLWADQQPGNRLSPWGAQRVTVELDWVDGAGYSFRVIDLTTNLEVAHGEELPEKRTGGRAMASFQPKEGHSYSVSVRQTRGKAGVFRLVALGAGLQTSTPEGSVPFPGDGAEVLAVGAVRVDGQRLAYSSCGRPGSSAVKPDVVAPVPFVSGWRDQPFSGTSAAAPQVAGVAALMWGEHPKWTAGQVREQLRSTARDLLTPGPDHETGFGLVHLPE